MAYRGINVVPAVSVFDNHVTDTADNMVFADGDNWVFATSGNPPDVIDEVYVGNVVMNRVYVGSDLVHERDQTQLLTLTSAEDLNLATWISGQGADPAVPVIINFASDQIIGGTVVGQPALTMGDLSSYASITFNVDGQIQGAPGSDAVLSQSPIDIINSGTISGAIADGVDTNGANVTMVISSTGKVLAGGGNGGNGGRGGNGDDVVSCTAWRNGWTSDSAYRTPVGTDTGRLIIYWGDNSGSKDNADKIYDGGATSMINYITGGKNTQRGSFALSEAGNGWYDVRQCNMAYGSGGSGGAGGLGQGYNVARTDGSSGNAGTYRSGSGGNGGNGGDWGVAGSSGNSGGGGLYHTANSSNNVRAGQSGTAGTSAGKAFVSSGVINLYGAGSPQLKALGL